jgi:cation transporter-like permease
MSNHERLLNHFTATGREFMLPFAIFSCLLAIIANYMDLSILKSIKLYRTWYPIYIIKTVLIAITGYVLAFFQQELLSVSIKTFVQMFVGISIALSGAILYSLINIRLSNEGKDLFDSVVD